MALPQSFGEIYLGELIIWAHALFVIVRHFLIGRWVKKLDQRTTILHLPDGSFILRDDGSVGMAEDDKAHASEQVDRLGELLARCHYVSDLHVLEGGQRTHGLQRRERGDRALEFAHELHELPRSPEWCPIAVHVGQGIKGSGIDDRIHGRIHLRHAASESTRKFCPCPVGTVRTAVHFHEARPVGCEHHLGMGRAVLKAERIEHAPSVVDEHLGLGRI
mmetsp:Transcript_35250/g.92498  ORF Transcript_35250/g.92498 Transcript_35250/m.92498 type:complete len:219 (+) Transcript_35250:515-1171(+)